MWFPKIDRHIEDVSNNCKVCRESASHPRREYSPWPTAQNPWERIHLDFAGPYFGKMWMICVDSFSKFPYVVEMNGTTSSTTITALQKILAVEGLPRTIVSDNGTQFTSAEFQRFCDLNSIRHRTTAPFHPASNGQAERFVRTFKSSFGKIVSEVQDHQKALLKFLLTYRTSPNPQSGKSPAELLHGRQPRNLLSVLIPETDHEQYNGGTKFHPGQSVLARNFSRGKKWAPGNIKTVVGRKMFVVQTQFGLWRRHQNQILARTTSADDQPIEDNNPDDDVVPIIVQPNPNHPQDGTITSEPDDFGLEFGTPPENIETSPKQNQTVTVEPGTSFETPVRRSERPRKPTVRFEPECINRRPNK